MPPEIWARLQQLASPLNSPWTDTQLVGLAATAISDLDRRKESLGHYNTPWPDSVMTLFNCGAARNMCAPVNPWPTDFASLVSWGSRPIEKNLDPAGWTLDEDYLGSPLLENGSSTPECREIAMPGRDPLLELDERAGYQSLRNICQHQLPPRGNGDRLYADWRLLTILDPLLDDFSSFVNRIPAVATDTALRDLHEAFYGPLPQTTVDSTGMVAVCRVSGLVLAEESPGVYLGECRMPEAVRLARTNQVDHRPWTRQLLYLRRAFRLYWTLPGLTEVQLKRELAERGWTCQLWPNLDLVDIVAETSGRKPVAVDVKDHLSPGRLAARFNGFKRFQGTHDCYLVVPDYLDQPGSHYLERFRNVRASAAKASIRIRTVSSLLEELAP